MDWNEREEVERITALLDIARNAAQSLQSASTDATWNVRHFYRTIDLGYRTRYRQTKRGRVPRLDPFTRALQTELRRRSGRR